MPKIIVHSPVGTFDAAQRHSVAAELTDFAIECEALPASPFVKSTVWTYFNEYAADACAVGGREGLERLRPGADFHRILL